MIELPPRKKRKTTETDIVRAAIDALCKIPGVRARRNNNGVLEDRFGTHLRYGLGDGSPDIVGIVTIGGPNSAIRTGHRYVDFAAAFGIEMKSPIAYARNDHGRSPDQSAWARSAEGLNMPVWPACSVAQSVDLVRAFIQRFEG